KAHDLGVAPRHHDGGTYHEEVRLTGARDGLRPRAPSRPRPRPPSIQTPRLPIERRTPVIDVNTFDELRIGLATADDIRGWSTGEVKKPETINYRTLKPAMDGLFRKRVRFKGIVCERCGVEVTKSSVRRERMGHVELAAPVTHIWYFKGVPSRLGYLLDLAPKDLEKIIYFAAYMITDVDEQARHEDM